MTNLTDSLTRPDPIHSELETPGSHDLLSASLSALAAFRDRCLQPDAGADLTDLRVRDFWVYQIRLPITAVCLLTGLGLTFLSPPRVPQGCMLDVWLSLLAVAFLVGGISLRLWAIASIYSRKTSGLVSTGPYSLCRNPLYVGTLLIVLGYLCVWKSLTLTYLAIPVVLLYAVGVVPIEEQVMLLRHGESFRRYCAAVPRWIPRFRGYTSGPTCSLQSSGFSRELQCGLWWLVIAMLMQMAYNARLTPNWVHPLDLL
ncbi:methyltransferase family protein [Planctomicrobium sp. SH664]|uniref:methyltransferase family protein n=1 Tax=Planctomicrobium sp. SH664 TaxID=3448125 RepID=UPI003F5C7A76